MFGKKGIDKTISYIKTIRYKRFATHFTYLSAFFVYLSIFGLSYCYPGYGHVKGNNRFFGTCKCHLDRAAYLSAINFCGHYCTKCPNVIEIFAHPVLGPILILPRWFFLLFFSEIFFGLFLKLSPSALMLIVKHSLMLHVNFISRCFIFG